MTWQRPTIQQIYDRIRADLESRVTADVPIPRVSMLGIMAIVFSGASHLFYAFLLWLSEQMFVDTSELDGLTRWGNIFNLPRKASDFSTGVAVFTGTPGKTVITGTIFTNGDGYEYETTEDFVIGITTSAAATSVLAGEIYNTDDLEFDLSSPDPDIDTIVTTFANNFKDGVDIETPEAWVVRLLQRFQNPPSSGTKADYERWALEVAGIERAECYPAELWAGAGTVGVGVGLIDWSAVAGSALTDVTTYIDEVKPIPAEVTVFNSNPLPTKYYISLTPNTADMRSSIGTELALLHSQEGYPGSTILLSHIRASIAAAGPDDYIITDIELDTVSIGVVNIETLKPDVPSFDTIVFVSL